uniref:Uncharacterized protein n=1 Tax=Octopus bimaculoides TaxID=37653 RepID=A0A0L8FM13_OCTBM
MLNSLYYSNKNSYFFHIYYNKHKINKLKCILNLKSSFDFNLQIYTSQQYSIQ